MDPTQLQYLQGSNPFVQGSSPTLQPTAAPAGGQVLTNPGMAAPVLDATVAGPTQAAAAPAYSTNPLGYPAFRAGLPLISPFDGQTYDLNDPAQRQAYFAVQKQGLE